MRERKRIRKAGYDYAKPGAYFVTFNPKNRGPVFGKIIDGEMHLNKYGNIVKNQWEWLFQQYHYLQIDEFVVMPDHFHGIIWIDSAGAGGDDRDRPVRDYPLKIKSIPELVGAFKSTSSKLIHLAGFSRFKWHRSYHDQIIHSKKDLNRIRRYIIDNPKNY